MSGSLRGSLNGIRTSGCIAMESISPDKTPLRDLLRVAVKAARAGGDLTLESFGTRLPAETKADGSPVTAADRACEAELRRVILDEFPTHTILGEEGGATPGDPAIRWTLDPIDGTKSFIHGVPLYSVLVGVELSGMPCVGVIHLPALRETVEAASGLGCRRNGERVRVSAVRRLSDATVLTTSVRALERRGCPFRRLAEATGTQRGWGDAYGQALVATGRAEAMVDPGLKLWDVAPLMPIVKEAGGKLTDWSGVETVHAEDYLTSNGLLHEPLLRLMHSP